MTSKASKWLFDIIGGWYERAKLDRVFCRWIYFHIRSKIFSGPLTGVREGDPHMDPPLGRGGLLRVYRRARWRWRCTTSPPCASWTRPRPPSRRAAAAAARRGSTPFHRSSPTRPDARSSACWSPASRLMSSASIGGATGRCSTSVCRIANKLLLIEDRGQTDRDPADSNPLP